MAACCAACQLTGCSCAGPKAVHTDVVRACVLWGLQSSPAWHGSRPWQRAAELRGPALPRHRLATSRSRHGTYNNTSPAARQTDPGEHSSTDACSHEGEPPPGLWPTEWAELTLSVGSLTILAGTAKPASWPVCSAVRYAAPALPQRRLTWPKVMGRPPPALLSISRFCQRGRHGTDGPGTCADDRHLPGPVPGCGLRPALPARHWPAASRQPADHRRPGPQLWRHLQSEPAHHPGERPQGRHRLPPGLQRPGHVRVCLRAPGACLRSARANADCLFVRSLHFLTNVECLEGLFDTYGTFGRGCESAFVSLAAGCGLQLDQTGHVLLCLASLPCGQLPGTSSFS